MNRKRMRKLQNRLAKDAARHGQTVRPESFDPKMLESLAKLERRLKKDGATGNFCKALEQSLRTRSA